jgi:DNA repair protein RecN (Recombination protein N)
LIETLRITGLAIVESAELEFGPGLNVLTGETGAGKSIVLSALALLAGGRASAGTAREGSRSAAVEAIFGTGALPELEAQLDERGLSVEDHELVVTRSFARQGRSRAHVSGQLVPVSVLAELFGGRLEISSQHDSQALLRPEMHGRLLDRKGDLLLLRRAVGEGHRALRDIDRDLARLRERARERVQRQDFLAYQVREIDEAKLEPAEIESLRELRPRLAHAERLRSEGGATLARLAGDAAGAEGGAADALAEAARRLGELGALDPALAELTERASAAATEVRDIAGDLERHLDAIDADPARLDAIDERLHRVEQLQRKYGAGVEEVLAHRERAAAELADLEGADERTAELESARSERATQLEADARALSRGRERAAKALAEEVQVSLRDLAMPHARFQVALDPIPAPEGFPCGPTGSEAPQFTFSANRGEPLRPLRLVASGGELSRAFLSIKQALREEETGMVLVFDEVDAGIGGQAAEQVGRRLADLASHHQVLCITHLPQIAAFADTHFRVEKLESGTRTLARIERVEGAARVEEIARMAGGEEAGRAAREYARELLDTRSPRGENA